MGKGIQGGGKYGQGDWDLFVGYDRYLCIGGGEVSRDGLCNIIMGELGYLVL